MSDLSELTIAELVDKGYKLKEQMDALEVHLDACKVELRTRAKKNKKDFFIGNKHFATVSPKSSTECDPYDLYTAYGDLGREEDFFKAVKVLITNAKKDLGATVFGEISNVHTTPYNNVSFKENVPKKYLKK
jgi:hypothetical protein